jgi:hypothetical protein
MTGFKRILNLKFGIEFATIQNFNLAKYSRKAYIKRVKLLTYSEIKLGGSMVTYQKRILLVLFVAVLLTFSRSNILSAQNANNGNVKGNTDIIEDQEGDFDADEEFEAEEVEEAEKIIEKKSKKKSKKYRNTKTKSTPEQKRQKLIMRELKRFENANKSIASREKQAKKILKKSQQDRKKEIIKHDERIEAIGKMEFDD